MEVMEELALSQTTVVDLTGGALGVQLVLLTGEWALLRLEGVEQEGHLERVTELHDYSLTLTQGVWAGTLCTHVDLTNNV